MNMAKLDLLPKELANREIKECEIQTVVKNVSKISKDMKHGLINSVSSEILDFNISIYRISFGERLLFEIGCKTGLARLISCKVFILFNSRGWEECGQGTGRTEDKKKEEYNYFCNIILSVNLQSPFNKMFFLTNDAFNLKCRVTYFELTSPPNSATAGCRLGSPQRLRTYPRVENLLLSKEKNEPQKIQSNLADDLLSLFKEGTLCDTILRTESESFSAHKTVLSARSPVFKKMFTSDMKERANSRVLILDINADTLRRLLMFIYTDTIADMEWKNIMELYFAADKYQIDCLKFKCSTFLKSNIQPSNCCDLLLLSDIHQDADLKQFVQNYIVKRDQDVFGSEEWRNFMSNHVKLAADTMYFRYARK